MYIFFEPLQNLPSSMISNEIGALLMSMSVTLVYGVGYKTYNQSPYNTKSLGKFLSHIETAF